MATCSRRKGERRRSSSSDKSQPAYREREIHLKTFRGLHLWLLGEEKKCRYLVGPFTSLGRGVRGVGQESLLHFARRGKKEGSPLQVKKKRRLLHKKNSRVDWAGIRQGGRREVLFPHSARTEGRRRRGYHQ